MSKFRIVNLIDKLFVSCAIFLIIYAWINFFTRNLWLTFVLSLVFTFAVLFVLFYFINKKQQKRSTTIKLEDEINKNFLAFRLSSRTKKLELLNNILSLNFKTTLTTNCITFEKENKQHLIILATNYDLIDNTILLKILDETTLDFVDCLTIICNNVAPNIKCDFLKNVKIEFVTKKILFNEYFLKNNIFPDTSIINFNKTKFNFKDFVNSLFIPQKAKSYFVCGLILIFSSIILPYHYYYIVFGTILMLFSIICKLLPKCQN